MIRRSRHLLAALLLVAIGAALAASTASAAGAPAWRIETHAAPTHFVPGLSTGGNMYVITATNRGDAATSGQITITDELPPGFIPQPNPANATLRFGTTNDSSEDLTDCEVGPPVTCKTTHKTVPGERIVAWIPLQTPASGPAVVTNHITVSGGGAAPASFTEQTPFNADPVPFGIQHLDTSLTAPDGSAVTQAGAHPSSFRFGFGLNTRIYGNGNAEVFPAENVKDVHAKLPPGLVVNPTATPRCTEAQLETLDIYDQTECPDASAVGVVQFAPTVFGFPSPSVTNPVYNLVPPPGAAVAFGFQAVAFGIFIHIVGGVDAANGYALRGDSYSETQFGNVQDITLEFWGDPSSPIHDPMRGNCTGGGYLDEPCPIPPNPKPFLTMPSACSDSLTSGLQLTSWQNKDPGTPVSTTAEMTESDGSAAGVSGCGALEFNPTLKARPTTNVADSPSGLEADLHIPQSNDQNTLATANLKKAVVALPKGITINPGAGNGLAACSSSQIGLTSSVGQTPVRFNEAQPTCPDAAKIGTVEIETPLVDNPLPGSVYLAKPHDNPFDSLLALYVVVDDPQSGVLIKLPGHVVADPQSGQLTTTFDENPQLPFEDFKLNFFGGASGTLRTPEVCGHYSTTSELTPYSAPESGPPATPKDEYAISQGPSGACPASAAQVPNSPSFDAGSVSPIAGIHSPFVVHLRRADATQQFSAISVSPPPGLVAKLAGTTICPEAAIAAAANKSGEQEQANPSCPASSRVGQVIAGAGAGPAPYYAHGTAYLAGPYKGAPLSFAIITPATAGPFDLGTVVTRTAIYIDPQTAKVSAVADPLPRILDGIPLDVRTVDLLLDKPNFALNGTSCEPSSVTGQLTTTLSQSAPLFSRYQLGDCSALGFKPKLTLSLKGATTRGKHPALTATLEPRAGDANIAAASVALPHSEFLDQSHIGTVCTRVQFAAEQCPAASVYGTATVTSPLFDYPLTGNVYLRSSNNKLPDLVPDLRGPSYQPLEIEAAGRTDSIKGGIRNTFDFVPDAPFSKFTLQLFGGKKGLLQNSTNICKELNKATARYTAHNGATYEATPVLKAKCPKKARKGKRHQRGARHRAAR